jgi:hypothetical protein
VRPQVRALETILLAREKVRPPPSLLPRVEGRLPPGRRARACAAPARQAAGGGAVLTLSFSDAVAGAGRWCKSASSSRCRGRGPWARARRSIAPRPPAPGAGRSGRTQGGMRAHGSARTGACKRCRKRRPAFNCQPLQPMPLLRLPGLNPFPHSALSPCRPAIAWTPPLPGQAIAVCGAVSSANCLLLTSFCKLGMPALDSPALDSPAARWTAFSPGTAPRCASADPSSTSFDQWNAPTRSERTGAPREATCGGDAASSALSARATPLPRRSTARFLTWLMLCRGRARNVTHTWRQERARQRWPGISDMRVRVCRCAGAREFCKAIGELRGAPAATRAAPSQSGRRCASAPAPRRPAPQTPSGPAPCDPPTRGRAHRQHAQHGGWAPVGSPRARPHAPRVSAPMRATAQRCQPGAGWADVGEGAAIKVGGVTSGGRSPLRRNDSALMGSTGSGSRPSGAGTRAGGRHVSRVGRARLSNWAESVAHTWPVEAVEHVQRVFGEHDEPVQPLCTPQRHRSINECISVIHLRARWTLGPKLHAATDPNAALARVPAQAPGTRTSTREVSPSRDSPGPARS